MAKYTRIYREVRPNTNVMFADDFWASKGHDVIKEVDDFGFTTKIETSTDGLTRTLTRSTDSIDSLKKYKELIFSGAHGDHQVYMDGHGIIGTTLLMVEGMNAAQSLEIWNNL